MTMDSAIRGRADRDRLDSMRIIDTETRRALDITCAAMVALVLAPAMLLVALAIRLDSGSPILFSQLRLGQHGRPFWIYKFRKFRPDCDTRGCALTERKDDRMTKVGRILAASKLDELPQLWNVLRGDMSLVGPRPESIAFADCFRNGSERILDHKPGLFGPCQVMFRDENKLYPANGSVEEFYRQVLFAAKADVDLAYFSQRTLMSDLGWIVRGVWMIVAGPRAKPHLQGQAVRALSSESPPRTRCGLDTGSHEPHHNETLELRL